MKTVFTFLAMTIMAISIQAQMMMEDPYMPDANESYAVLLEIYYDNKPLDEWSFSKEKLTLGMGMYGDVTLKIVDPAERLTAIDNPTFQIAIKHNYTGTHRMLSNKIFAKISVEEILSQCKEGESVIILTTDRKYALPRNTIELMLGC